MPTRVASPAEPELDDVDEKRQALDQARAAFEQAIRQAHAGGASVRAIASRARLSSSRVHQLLRPGA